MKALSNLKWPVAGLILISFMTIPSLLGSSQIASASSFRPFSTQWDANMVEGSIISSTIELPPYISFQDSDVNVGQVISVPIVLSSAHQGLAGYLIEVSMSNSSVAHISSAEFPSFGMTYQAQYEGYNRLAAVDLFRLVESVDINSTIVTLNIMGLAQGTSDIQIRIIQMDDDDGNIMEPVIIPGTVTVY